jgi:hypothetical protein
MSCLAAGATQATPHIPTVTAHLKKWHFVNNPIFMNNWERLRFERMIRQNIKAFSFAQLFKIAPNLNGRGNYYYYILAFHFFNFIKFLKMR